jgi:hypothetical protein
MKETQKQKREKVNQIKERHENSKILPGTDDFEYFRNLLHNHPNPNKFDIDNIEYFIPKTDGKYIKPYIKIKDQPEVDFSLNSCITGKTQWDLSRICREAIEPQIKDFRINNTSVVCGICNQSLIDCPTHIDHIYPLSMIIKDFFGEETPETKSIQPHGRDFVDMRLKKQWQEYHRKNAKLQKTHQSCNCSKGAKL